MGASGIDQFATCIYMGCTEIAAESDANGNADFLILQAETYGGDGEGLQSVARVRIHSSLHSSHVMRVMDLTQDPLSRLRH